METNNNSVQPGQTIAPTNAAPPAAEPPAAAPPTETPAQPPAETPAEPPQLPPEPPAQAPDPAPPAPPPENPVPTVSTAPTAPTAPTESAPESPAAEASASSDPQTITWTASEFIAHAKSFGWYAALAAAAIIFAGVVFLISRDFVSVAVVIVAALVFGIYGGHQPKQVEYRLDASGLNIGRKHFGYGEFRSFSVLAEGAFSSIVFMPLKRFAVTTTIYYAPEDESKIVNLLSSRLPLEERGHDAIDRLLHRIHY